MKENPKAFDWDYDGQCIPDDNPSWKTFSVGIFQWLPKSGGKGVKRGKVVKRIKGNSYEKEVVFNLARAEVMKREKDDRDNLQRL